MEIRDIKGSVKFTTPINKGSIRRVNLMQEDYILLKFSTYNAISFNIGDNIPDGFELTESFKPVLNTKTNGYDYELRFDRYYFKWKNKKFFYAPDFGGREASWSLNADISTHLGVFTRNLKALGYKYNGLDFEFAISEVVGSESKLLQYENIDLISSLTRIAEEWNCEWWVTDNIINFGKCEYGTPIDFIINENVSAMPKSGANSAAPTRIYAFGSERNVPENYRPIEDSIAVNGIVQKRLMLPKGIPYIDVHPNLTNEEAVEEIKIFENVYPRRVNKISNVSRDEQQIKNENGKVETKIIYGVQDDTLKFKSEYILSDQELRVTFQSGLLNGRDYGVEFKDDYFLIKEEYGVPNDILYPIKGDEFVLYGYDTKFVDVQLLPEAEIELQEEAEKYVQELREDPNTYECKMMASFIFNDGNIKTFELGDRVRLSNKALFDEPRVSRIMGYEYPLDKPYDNPIYYVGRKATYSRLNRIESKIDALEYKEKLYASTNVGVYIITQHDITTPTDRNVLSSKRSLDMFLRKNAPDKTEFLQTFLDGIEIGEYVDSMSIGKGGAIDKQGNAQLQSLEVRGNLSVTELLINRLTAVESDYAFTGAGTVIKVESTINGYRLYFKKRYEADFIAFQKGDILRGVVNDLKNGNIHETFVRVELVDTTKNAVNVVMYPDAEVPSGKNYPPVELMVAQHRGNPINAKRQSCWYLSSQEGRIVFLDGVTKPILEDINYSSFWGKPPRLKVLENLPINYDQPYFYSRGTILQDIIRLDYEGVPIKEQVDLGAWHDGIKAFSGDDYPYQQTNVWHNSCKWRCVKDTESEPTIFNTDWVLLTGDTELTLSILSSCNFTYLAGKINDNIRVVVRLGLINITDKILPTDWSWTRETSNHLSDAIWNEQNKHLKSEFKLSQSDLVGVDFDYPVQFTCTAYYRAENKILKTFNKLNL